MFMFRSHEKLVDLINYKIVTSIFLQPIFRGL